MNYNSLYRNNVLQVKVNEIGSIKARPQHINNGRLTRKRQEAAGYIDTTMVMQVTDSYHYQAF
jgi:hypothetical protein